MATETLQRDATTATSWASALADYQREEAAYAAVASEYEAATAVYYAEHPDRDEEFATYGLKCPTLKHSHVMSDVASAIMRREFGKVGYPLYPPKDVDEYHAKYPAIMAEAARVTADYLDYRRHGSEAYERIVTPAEKRHDDACDKLWFARNKLLGTPAPDTEAMLFKLDVLAKILVEDDSQDASTVVTLRDDAKRLLAGE